jgi:hypothetical protein
VCLGFTLEDPHLAELDNIRTKLGKGDDDQQLVTIAGHYALNPGTKRPLISPATIGRVTFCRLIRHMIRSGGNHRSTEKFVSGNAGSKREQISRSHVTFRGKNRSDERALSEAQSSLLFSGSPRRERSVRCFAVRAL